MLNKLKCSGLGKKEDTMLDGNIASIHTNILRVYLLLFYIYISNDITIECIYRLSYRLNTFTMNICHNII